MVLTKANVPWGKSKGGSASPVPSDDKEDFPSDGSDIPKTKEMMKVPEEKKIVYLAAYTGFTERGARHAKDEELKMPITEERAKNLINAGAIKIKGEKEEPKPEEKAVEGAPIDRSMKSGDTEKKESAEGKGADLLKGKKSKKEKKK